MLNAMHRRVLLIAAGAVCTGCLGTPTEDSRSSATQTTSLSSATTSGTHSATTTSTAESHDKVTLKRPDSSTNNRPSSVLYFSEVLPNPQGPDIESLNHETVLIQTTTDSPTDLSGYTVTYGNDREYSFPRSLSDITPGTNITIHSGKGNNSMSSSDPLDYDLFVGSDRPLLRNNGMQLTLKSPNGDAIDSIQYPELGPDEGYYRPE